MKIIQVIMKKGNKLYVIILLLALQTACGGKKRTLEAEVIEEVAVIAPRDSMQRSKVVYNAIEAVTSYKTEEPGIGKKTIANKLVKLNLAQNNPEEKAISLDEFYTNVSYIKLQHPLADKGVNFLGNANIRRYIKHEKGEDVIFMSGFNSKVYFSENSIVAGDNYFGYHVYNKNGEFIYTIASPHKLPKYDSATNTINYHTNDMETEIQNFSIQNNKAFITVREDTVQYAHVYDIEKQKGIMAFAKMIPGFIINDNLFLSYNGSINIK